MQETPAQIEAEYLALRTALLSQPWYDPGSKDSAQAQLDRHTYEGEVMVRRFLSAASLLEQRGEQLFVLENHVRLFREALGLGELLIGIEDLVLRAREMKAELDRTKAQLRVMGEAMDRAASG